MSQPGRRRLSITCIVIGALALSLALPLAYLDRNVFQARGFSNNAAATLDDAAVRAEISSDLTRAIVAREPQAVSFAPLLLNISDALLRTSQAHSLVRSAAVQTHNAVFSATKGSVVIDLANLSVIALELLKTQRPAQTRDLAQPQKIALQLSDRSLTVRAIEAADSVRLLAVVLPLLALALFAVGLFTVAERRRAALNVGIAVFLVGALNFAAFLVVRAVVLTNEEGDRRDVVGGIFDAFLGRFPLWCGVLALAGAIVAASAASVIGELDPARVPALLWDRITREPDATWKLVAGAVVLILAGLAVIGDPIGAVSLAVSVFGAWLIFAGAVTLLRLIIGPAPTPAELPSARALRRRLVPVVLGALLLIGVSAAGVGLVLDGRSAAQPVVNTNPGCNGYLELCGRRLNEVTFATTHNAMSSAQALFLNPNQGVDMLNQLDSGVRGMQLDAYLGQRNGKGTVRTDLAPKAVDAAEAKIGPEGLRAAQRLAGSVAFGPVQGKKQVYLCHVLCELGALEAVPTFKKIKDWMDRNPREVLMFVIEDAAPTAAIKQAFGDSGLAGYANAETVGDGRPFPTLEEMIRSGKRLWIMAEENGERTGWYRRAYDLMQETPYAFSSVGLLRSPTSCRPNRGGTTPPLFLMNHWVESYPPRPRDADVVNQLPFLLTRARECERQRDRTVNMLAVDFAERGDLIAATTSLNGLKSGPATP